MDRQQAANYVQGLLRKAVDLDASDLFVTVGAPPSAKINGEIVHLSETPLSVNHTQMLVRSIMNDKQVASFEETREANFAISLPGIARFRVNAFMQRGSVGMVLRMIRSDVPNFAELLLPKILEDISMTKRGLVIFVGATSSGKSTSLAAMLDFRNEHSKGHIVTIEDPIEYVHRHKGCLVTQREVGVDTESFESALKNTLRQAPDVILIGEIRDRDTMDHAVAFAETGHLCLATLHANNTNQALDRIINFFPEERRHQLLMDLSLNLKSVISQRLLRKEDGVGRVPAVEVLINTPLIGDLIFKGDVHEIKEVMKRSREHGMQTFDQALLDLYDQGQVSYPEALRNADSQNDLRLSIKLHSRRGLPKGLNDDDNQLQVEKED
ncbi:MAG: type IV pili twitching motility protein PilT [Halothiobacillus sp. 24-54-40]|jgi:twitching motility protein PilU|nr:PilT/PilU family type 4a pilus ATPase [Halothiobacillaceae bacterium]OYV46698.1 MAG: type IV pili twitching motility protein PilT [Halothiobacillus sp. 20-53-49]OYY43841.1 MAG: type IV pili twitching motility protein PilT [Halothiobacillus sp. 35-54-62]OYZ88195.1 MAG: type IV pili twitching motility protein PilT [Halothiobacillus sp. 24-54-40]OZA80693.1 MAG: type IV pili twitching motility protein PilT [Halothiobacillus sp. 39-53-45]HQS01855.1 PilT/PilU family type 4a pilus ATPase [Halothio